MKNRTGSERFLNGFERVLNGYGYERLRSHVPNVGLEHARTGLNGFERVRMGFLGVREKLSEHIPNVW